MGFHGASMVLPVVVLVMNFHGAFTVSRGFMVRSWGFRRAFVVRSS